MKKLSLLITLLISGTYIHAQTPCDQGFADIYGCSGIDLLSFMPINEIGEGANMNDIWGWTSPNGRELVIAGRSSGTSFVDITDPLNPIYLGNLPTHTVNSLWRDMKVHNGYAFIVSEAGEHGMQVMDLNEVLAVENPPVEFSESAFYGGFGNCHNIVINEESGFAYAVGTSTFSGGLHVIDITNPLEPVIAGGFGDSGYVHDAQVVNYNGPDTDYAGKELAFCCNGGSFVVADVTVKDDIYTVSTRFYDNLGYVHQSWLTEDHRYMLQNDETDEVSNQFNTRTHLWDLLDLDNPVYMGFYEGPVLSSDHNLYIKGNLGFMSNYYSGLRVVDVSNIANAELTEIAYFDVEPSLDIAGYSGSWSNYPYFESETIAVTSMARGLFMVRLQEGLVSSVNESSANGVITAINIGPNPAQDFLNLRWSGLSYNSSMDIYNTSGQLQRSIPVFSGNGSIQLDVSDLASGMYFVKSSDSNTRGISFLID